MNNKEDNIVRLEINKRYDSIIIIIIIIIIIEFVHHITAEGKKVAQIQCKNWRHDKLRLLNFFGGSHRK